MNLSYILRPVEALDILDTDFDEIKTPLNSFSAIIGYLSDKGYVKVAPFGFDVLSSDGELREYERNLLNHLDSRNYLEIFNMYNTLDLKELLHEKGYYTKTESKRGLIFKTKKTIYRPTDKLHRVSSELRDIKDYFSENDDLGFEESYMKYAFPSKVGISCMKQIEDIVSMGRQRFISNNQFSCFGDCCQ